MKQKYIISPETFHDADLELYYTHIVNNDSEKRFAFIAYGLTEQESRDNAKHLVLCLEIN